MDLHVREFFKESSDGFPNGNYRKVIALHEAPDITWEALQEKSLGLTRGWFELAHLPPKDRIEFTRDFWLATLPYHPKLQDTIIGFFDSLDDIGIFITQKHFEDEYVIQMVYSIANDGGFFRGFEPAGDNDINAMELSFPGTIFPEDYLAFLRIHNGFRKATDKTGVFKTVHMMESYNQFQKMIDSTSNIVTTERGLEVNPQKLIPFYESFGMPFFQCFWEDWYPQNVTGMGNVYFSVSSGTISDPMNYEDSSSLNMSFTRFLDWLMFYLERIE